ncbi:O-antigen ligase family protein [Bradyrhizobium diazoefficiens]|nr:O-antigen ligase family protein [Bradyrhizobium diazoefficiens]MBR0704828.1 O-antigen ligase family protein [Bradyrhizobium diazoefficiens]MBR0773177.1 O-antigen ligase family protein [Bradyrhizobium diazoefficiens]
MNTEVSRPIPEARTEAVLVNYGKGFLAAATAAIVTMAAYSKMFVPFYLIGSTTLFVAAVAVGVVLVALSWRTNFEAAGRVPHALIVTALFYAMVVVSYLTYSHAAVPLTHLLGILIIHGIMLIFGFSAARALKTVLLILFSAAATYAALLALHAVRFGGVTEGIGIGDIFGIGVPAIYITFHQNIGFVLGIGTLALLGLAPNRALQILALITLPILALLLFHIAARTALVALVCSLVFLGFARLWAYSKKAASISAAVIIVATITLGVFSWQSVNQMAVDATAPDAVSRTIRELQDPNPGFRLPIWENIWRHIVTEPDRLVFGRGIGMYPVQAGFGPPDWLLHSTEGSKHYPHNVHLEVIYETGALGLLLFSILTFLPIVALLRRWSAFSAAEKSAFAIYVFNLVSSEISGAFAYTYMLQFFLALCVGIIALKETTRASRQGGRPPPCPRQTLRHNRERTGSDRAGVGQLISWAYLYNVPKTNNFM